RGRASDVRGHTAGYCVDPAVGAPARPVPPQRRVASAVGTQYLRGADGLELEPVTDPDALDARRAEVGLPPVADALRDLRLRLAAAPRTSDQKNDGASTASPTESA
ncbi:hypothetical protein AB0E97_38050, partial [Streptomyces microflavus]